MMANENSEAHVIADIAAAIGGAQQPAGLDLAPYAVVPEGWRVSPVPKECAPRPHHVAKLRDAASFLVYLERNSDESTVIYATLQPARFVAVLRDNFADGSNALCSFRDWRADFTVPASREWVIWTQLNGKPFSQVDFAHFLQDNLPDITEPDGADLLALVLNFEASTYGAFVSAQRLQDGAVTFNWRSDTTTGVVKLPEHIKISIPVFENEAPRELLARFRYRLKDGALSLWFELVRPHKVMEAAFRELWKRIEEQGDAPVLLGTPE